MQANDACWWHAPWKKHEQEWQATTNRAQQHLAKIADSIQKTTYLDGEHWGALSDCTVLQERASSRLWELVHRCRRRLDEELQELGSIVANMRGHLYDETAIASKKNLDDTLRLRYESFLIELVTMYERELLSKAMVASDIANCDKHDTMTLYIAAWQMQPHIDRARIDEVLTLIQNDAHYK